MNTTEKDNLTKALAIFIEAFRPYIASVLMNKYGENWQAEFANTVLLPEQRKQWDEGLRTGSTALSLLDYPHFKHFAIKYKELIKADFEKKTSDIPNWLGEIYETRNKVAHYSDKLDADEVSKTWIHMRSIAKFLKMNELETELNRLSGKLPIEKPVEINPEIQSQPLVLMPWFRQTHPHFDIREGRLDESVFAANLAEVALGNGREVYKDAFTFFSKTYFTAGLKSIAKTVVKGLNGKEDAENRVISLQTGFGGGKTHTLISLYHLCKSGKNANQWSSTKALLAYTGIPEFETANIAVFTNTTNDPANGRTPAGESNVHIKTIWGELAYQLGGKEAYEIIRKNDEEMIAPAGLFKQVLEICKPALILVDELADYCVKASGKQVGKSSLADQTISFMQELTEAVAGSNNCVAVITLPASPQEVGNTTEAQAILSSLQKRVSRVGADTQPVADDEIYEVIRRRLFEDIGDERQIEAIATKYLDLYQTAWTELPTHSNKLEYKKRLIKSYPFHPELIDIFRIRWASHHDFQRTRGVLRLLASLVSDLWQRQQSLPGNNLLIHSGVINLANLDAMSGQIKKLYGNGYDAVITADVAGSASNAFKIDTNEKEYGNFYLTQAIASVILMNSFGSDGANKGISVAEIKLNLLMPEGFNHNNVNGALSKLESVAHYLYCAQSGGQGKRYWFHTKPNINILINQAKGDIKENHVTAEILKRIEDRTKFVKFFKVLVNPSEDIPEQMKPTLVILSPNYLANPNQINGNTKPLIEKIATKKGNSERIYRNTMLFLVCNETSVSSLQSSVREYLACQKINQEYQSQLETDQRQEVKRRMDEAAQKSDRDLGATYNILLKHTVKNGIEKLLIKENKETLDSQIELTIVNLLKQEFWILDSVGLNTFRTNNLAPTLEQNLSVKEVAEAFIRYDDKPMVSSLDVVSNSLQKYCENGEFCIAYGDGKTFSRYYLGERISFFDVTSSDYWLVDNSKKPAHPKVEEQPITEPVSGDTLIIPNIFSSPSIVNEPIEKNVFSITVSGKVAFENYTQIMNSFIIPLMNNEVEIELKVKGKSTLRNPIKENGQLHNSIKESAKQLGLNFEVE